MTHSKVFTDGDTLFVLVAHPEDAEEKLIAPDGYQLYGLMEYSVSVEGGEMFIYDYPDDEESMYAPDERWEGVDGDAVAALLEAAESGEAADLSEGFYQIRDAYKRNMDDPEGTLSGVHPVGTVVRIDYAGSIVEADAFVKRDVDFWEVTGGFTTYTDEEIESEDYEVIYHV